jgi:hypothetical protein
MTVTTAKLRHSAFTVSLLSLLPHIFCCLLPTVMAVASLGTTVGLATALGANPLYRLVDAYHIYFLGLAVTTVLISGAVNLVAWRLDCRTQGHCHHEPCAPKKSNALKVFFLSLALLAFDISYFFVEQNVLGLHSHLR